MRRREGVSLAPTLKLGLRIPAIAALCLLLSQGLALANPVTAVPAGIGGPGTTVHLTNGLAIKYLGYRKAASLRSPRWGTRSEAGKRNRAGGDLVVSSQFDALFGQL